MDCEYVLVLNVIEQPVLGADQSKLQRNTNFSNSEHLSIRIYLLLSGIRHRPLVSFKKTR